MSSITQTVLVVDDEPTLRHMMARALVDEGYQVLTAEDGRDALAVADDLAAPPSLVVTDLDMPGMNGTELATRLARLTPAPRVLFVSGGGGTVRELSGAFLPKPFLLEDLIQRVRGIIGAPNRRTSKPSI